MVKTVAPFLFGALFVFSNIQSEASCLLLDRGNSPDTVETYFGVVRVLSEYPAGETSTAKTEGQSTLIAGSGIVVKVVDPHSRFLVVTASHIVGGSKVGVLNPSWDADNIQFMIHSDRRGSSTTDEWKNRLTQVLKQDVLADIAILDWPNGYQPSSYFVLQRDQLVLKTKRPLNISTLSGPTVHSIAEHEVARSFGYERFWTPRLPWACQADLGQVEPSPSEARRMNFELDPTGQYMQIRASFPFGYSGAPVVATSIDGNTHFLVGLVTQFGLFTRRSIIATAHHIVSLLTQLGSQDSFSRNTGFWSLSDNGTLVRQIGGVESGVVENSSGKAFVGDPGKGFVGDPGAGPVQESSNQAAYTFRSSEGEVFGYQLSSRPGKRPIVLPPEPRSLRQLEFSGNLESSNAITSSAELGALVIQRYGLEEGKVLEYSGCFRVHSAPISLKIQRHDNNIVFDFEIDYGKGCEFSFKDFFKSSDLEKVSVAIPLNLIDPKVGAYVPVYKVSSNRRHQYYVMDLSEFIYSKVFGSERLDSVENHGKDESRIYFGFPIEYYSASQVVLTRKSN